MPRKKVKPLDDVLMVYFLPVKYNLPIRKPFLINGVWHLPLSRDMYAMINYECIQIATMRNWYIKTMDSSLKKDFSYPVSNLRLGIKGTPYELYLHRVLYEHYIGEIPEGWQVDHRNLNTLDNRLENLRACPPEMNSRNRGQYRPRPTSTSLYKGVQKSGKRWTARIRINHVDKYLGTFDTEEEAALAYDEVAMLHSGRFARTNIMPNKYDQ